MSDNILTIKEWLVNKLKEKMDDLPAEDRIAVEKPPSIENYNLIHPIGAVIVLYAGSTSSESSSANKIIQDKNYEFGIVLFCRNIPGKRPPEYYIQYITDSLSGLSYFAQLIYFNEDRFIDELNGVWSYYLKLIVPGKYMDKKG